MHEKKPVVIIHFRSLIDAFLVGLGQKNQIYHMNTMNTAVFLTFTSMGAVIGMALYDTWRQQKDKPGQHREVKKEDLPTLSITKVMCRLEDVVPTHYNFHRQELLEDYEQRCINLRSKYARLTTVNASTHPDWPYLSLLLSSGPSLAMQKYEEQIMKDHIGFFPATLQQLVFDYVKREAIVEISMAPPDIEIGHQHRLLINVPPFVHIQTQDRLFTVFGELLRAGIRARIVRDHFMTKDCEWMWNYSTMESSSLLESIDQYVQNSIQSSGNWGKISCPVCLSCQARVIQWTNESTLKK